MYNPDFKILALFCDCSDLFVSDLVGDPEVMSGLSHHFLGGTSIIGRICALLQDTKQQR